MDTETNASNLLTSPIAENAKKPEPKPTAKKPAAKKTTAKKPAAKKTTAKKPAKKTPGVKSAIDPAKLIAALKKKPRTALELAKLFKRSAVSVKRQLYKTKGIKSKVRAPNGGVGRRPNVYSLAG